MMENEIKSKLDQIAKCIFDGIENNDIQDTNGLYDGKFGILLFLYYYSKYTNDNKTKLLTDAYAEDITESIWTNTPIPTFCSGLAGILYLFDFLREQKLVDIDIDDIESEFSNYLNNFMKMFITGKNYDFMHGALGIGLYFLKHKKNKVAITELIDFLYNTSEKDFDNIIFKWKSTLNEEKEIGYNIALSHGMSSIILFLSRVIKENIEHTHTRPLLEGAINYILSQEIDVDQYGCFFPSQSLENNKPIYKSRLAWCYGDLGVAYSIWYAGKTLNKKEWIDKGMDILINTAKRRDTENNYVVDAGICHGSIGIAMVYKRLFIESNNPLFLETSNYWLRETLSFSTYQDGLAGYKSARGKGLESECDYSLLSGIGGIGLMFISYLMNDLQEWDELFLLS